MVQTQDEFLQRVAFDYGVALPVSAPEMGKDLVPIVDAQSYRRRFRWLLVNESPTGAGGPMLYIFTVPVDELWCFSTWHQVNNSGDTIRTQATIVDKDGTAFSPMVVDFDIIAGDQATLIGDVNGRANPTMTRYRRPRCLMVYPEWDVSFRIFVDGGILGAGAQYASFFIFEVLPVPKSVHQQNQPVVSVP